MRLSNSVGRTASRILIGVATAGLLLFSTQILESQQSEPTQYVIERIDISGYRSIQISTIRAHILSRPGNLYNAEAVQRDADALRNAGYFSEVRLRVEDSPDRANGKIVVFKVIENQLFGGFSTEKLRRLPESIFEMLSRATKLRFLWEADSTKLL
jgi:outer membrane protein assembly factor BamA